jgi:ABC-type lipoprotein release transport system permease subunit
MNLFLLANRNISRTKQRAWVTIGAMGLAGFIMIFYAALLEGLILTTKTNAIGMELGEVQVHAHEYRNDPDLYKLIENGLVLINQLKTKGYNASGRLFSFGLAAAGNSSAGVQVRGIDLQDEPTVTRLHRHLQYGSWLKANDTNGVILGRKLARTLGVSIGDEVVILGQAADGSMANDLFTVNGVLKSVGSGIDRAGFIITAQAFRHLMALPSGFHEIAISRPDPVQPLDTFTRQLAEIMPDHEVRNWRQLQPVLARIVDLSQSSLIIMLLVTYTAVGILTLNSMLMSVFERIHEFGVMKALGFSPFKVFSLIGLETMLQVSYAALIAIVTGVPLSIYCETHPIDLSFLATTSSTIAGIAIEPVWYTKLTAGSIFSPILFLYIISGLAILYPAVKAALIRPLQAIYFK